MPNAWFPRVTVAAVVERQNRFLLVEERIDGRLVLNQPAGHWEQGESLIQAVQRETREETAWWFTPEALVGVYRWTHPRKGLTYLRFAFSGSVSDHDPSLPLDREVQQTRWLTEPELRLPHVALRSPQVLAVIDDYLAGRCYPLECIRDVTDVQSHTQVAS